jgi:ABC-type multidrug transport system permease subunit
MKVRRHLWLALVACAAIAVLFAAGQTVSAQCAMCRSALAGSPEAAKLSARINLGVLVLLVPPVAIFCGIFYAVFKQLKSRDGSERANEGTRMKT